MSPHGGPGPTVQELEIVLDLEVQQKHIAVNKYIDT